MAATDDASQSSFPLTGFLLRLPGGYVRFMPHTQAFNSEDMTAFMHSERPSSSPASSVGFPFSSESTASKQSLLELLPSKRQCDELIQRYLVVFSPVSGASYPNTTQLPKRTWPAPLRRCFHASSTDLVLLQLFHILHDPTLHIRYTEFCNAPGEVAPAFLALLFVILAVAILTLEVDDPLLEELSRERSGIARIRSIAARYRQAAMKCLSADQFMVQHNLDTVKSLVLLIYAMSHTDGPTWPLLGLTLHIATAIGCHIDPKHLDVGPVEAEERRRCWAGLKMLYQNQATCMGNLLPNPVSADVDLPADVNDDEITESGVRVLLSAAAVDGPFPSPSRPPTQMTYILYKFRLYKVATDICHATLSLLPLQSPLLRSLNARIAQEEDEHARRFSDFPDLPLYHRANMHVLKNYTNQLYLILHRPYLKSGGGGSFSSRGGTLDAADLEMLHRSRTQCKHAAMAILESHKQLYETPGYRNYYWYVYRLGSFNAFLGASTLLALLLDPHLLILSDQESSAILGMVGDCAERLDAMAERSEVCAKASPILRRLFQRAERQVQDRSSRSRRDTNNINNINNNNNGPDSVGSGIPFSLPPDTNAVAVDPSSTNAIDATTTAAGIDLDLDGWPMHPELNAIMSHLPPEQWLAPSAFYWDRCWQSAEGLETNVLVPNSWG